MPRFQPLPGGFGKRQTPVGEKSAAAPEPAPLPAERKDAARPGAADTSGVHSNDNPTAKSSAAKSSAAKIAAGGADDNPLGLVAIGGGLATFGDGKEPGPDHVPTRLAQWLNKEFRHVRDTPCETALTVVGALAGFAAQHGIWEAMVKPGRMAIQEAFVVIETRSGETYFFGDFLNTILASPDPAQLSVWKIVGGAARAMGAEELPDLTPIFKHCAETVGTGSFGLPRLPDGHLPTILPRDAVNRYWPEARRILAGRGADADPMTWALDVAVAAQQLMLGMKDRIDPLLAAQAVMEAAVPMSRIDPMTVPKD